MGLFKFILSLYGHKNHCSAGIMTQKIDLGYHDDDESKCTTLIDCSDPPLRVKIFERKNKRTLYPPSD